MTTRFLDESNSVFDTFIHTDSEGFGIEKVQKSSSIDPIIELNKTMRSARGNDIHKTMHHVGSIPLSIWAQWVKEDPELQYNTMKVLEKLRSSEWIKLRTSDRI